MRNLLILLSLTLLLSSCSTGIVPLQEDSQPEAAIAEQSGEESDAPKTLEFSKPEAEQEKREILNTLETAYTRAEGMSKEDVIEAYFEQQYLSYINMKYIDLSSILDMDKEPNRNMARWSKMLMQRRKLLQENKLCYVETQQFSYKIDYVEEPNDERMSNFESWAKKAKNTVVHLKISGEKGKVYPPIMAMNSVHTIFLKMIDGNWKIVLHYFPGSMRKFTRSGTIVVPTEAAMLAELRKEFIQYKDTPDLEIPEGATAYDTKKAVAYAKKHTEERNPKFYEISDWTGNCANFVSQCVWAGFGGGNHMTAIWKPGTVAWQHVNSFWDAMDGNENLGGQQLHGMNEMRNGDIVQVRSATVDGEENRYTHMMMLVDEENMILAQNTPDSYVYASDIVNVKTRFIRPAYIIN